MTHLALVVALCLGHMPPETVPEPSEDSWSLVLLVDVSLSMKIRDRDVPVLLAAIDEGLVARLAPGERVRIGAYASEIKLPSAEQAAKDPLGVLREALSGDPEWRYGPSRLWDAVDAASAATANEPGRRVVVVISDSEATGNAVGRHRIMSNLQDRNTELWAINTNHLASARWSDYLGDLGGRVARGHLDERLAPILAEVLQALRTEARKQPARH